MVKSLYIYAHDANMPSHRTTCTTLMMILPTVHYDFGQLSTIDVPLLLVRKELPLLPQE